MISKNIKQILAQIGPNAKLVTVTKNRTLEQITEAIQNGITVIGENRLQEAQEKFPKLSSPVQKHFIGHLQTNKVKPVLGLFDLIESVDSLHLAKKISRVATKKVPILLQVNIADDPNKSGFTEKELRTHLSEIKSLPNLDVRGLMTIVPYFENPESTRPYFRQMKALQTELNLPELSMGMSNDYQIAAQEGATIVRIGSAIFQ